MLEVEVKIRLDEQGLEELRRQLPALTVDTPTTLEQEDLYFSHPDRDLKARDEALRLRLDSRLAITWKGPKLDPPLKTREEIEFGLDTDCDTATRLLVALGYQEVARVTKTREQWRIAAPSPALICLDNVVGLGWFVEVEVEAEQAAEGRMQLEAVLRLLSLDQREFIATSYLGLLASSAE
ncbi:MAG: class IV adenylate cyclase [Candidatus Binatia bacterium]|nr:class IV adenylate cyclase [Candidatus Binatia bacterium]MDG1957324.1 class IV adenylate cyclase [Candidatus Binatia bacterium]MDG2011436.1 class IV adenylate cyclase [Candidatus Binatia bacterium]